MKPSSNGGLVYSTDSGRMCPDCRRPLADCACKAQARIVGDGKVRISLQTKGRGGKAVTLVKGVAFEPAALAALGKTLRTACGSGGTVKDGVIEIQGDHCELVLQALARQGIEARRAGG
nr:Translation initiation factor SUI1 [uncultured organism]